MSLYKIASYVPALLLRRAHANPQALEAPVLENFAAAVMFADISGFTKLTERLAERGPAGIEELTNHLSTYFGQLITLINSYGGDVVKFAGDALLAVWPATEVPLEIVTDWAAHCSLAILSELQAYTVDDVHFSLHVGISAGEVMGLHVGGVRQRWEFLLAGQPLIEMAYAAAHAKSGEACISATAWSLIQKQYEGTALETGYVRLDAVRSRSHPEPCVTPVVLPEMAAILQTYIPAGILARLEAGQTEWLAEFRRISVLFVQLPWLDYPPHGSLEQVQQAMQVMQQAIYQYEGTVRQFILDDKGSVLVAAFGLPPFAHEDDAERALLAALAMQNHLLTLSMTSAIGVTTGWVYCGLVGSEMRSEYTVVGDIVNLAARLMVAAKDKILCDEATYQAVQGRLVFERLPAIQVKGKTEPITVYCPCGQGQRQTRLTSPMVGRLSERQLLLSQLQALQAGTSGVVVIEGEPGIGKSRLIQDLSAQAKDYTVETLLGAGDAITRSTPYHAWRSLFSDLLGLETAADAAAGRAQVQALLSAEEHLMRFAPLLNAIVPLDFPENPITAQMTGQARADQTRELLVKLLQSATKSSLLLILEDAHWLDSASWGLALAIAQQVQSLLFVLTTRPLSSPLPQEYRQILQSPKTQQLRLSALQPEDTLQLVSQRLGVRSLPLPVANLIREKAEGNPFFSEELAYALQAAGLIAIQDGECHLCVSVADSGQTLASLQLPDTVQGLITSRIDRLTPTQQLTLKVASVIGRQFFSRLLYHIYPIESERKQLADTLNSLEQLNFTLQQTPPPDEAYIFRHIITQEAAYNQMLYAQRRQLHRCVAEWYEQNYADDLSPFYSLLAHHWRKAEVQTKAIDYLEKAGEQALRTYSLEEAVHCFSEALSLDRAGREAAANSSKQASTLPMLRQARWERQLGEAYLGLGQLLESRDHLINCLVFLGRSRPPTGLGLVAGLLVQVLRQVLHRLGYLHLRRKPLIGTAALMEMARAYDLLAEVYYHANEIAPTIDAALRTLNLAECAGPSPELARAYASSSFAAGVIPLHALARAYSQKARAIAQIVDQPVIAEARVLIITSVYAIGIGQWAEVEAALQRSLKICQDFGDRHQWGNCMAILAKTAYFQGNFARGIQLWASLYSSAHHSGDVLHQAWGLNGQAEGLLRLGQVERAVGLLESSLELFAQNRDRVSETATRGMLATAYLLRGEQEQAHTVALATAQQLAQLPSPSSYYLIAGYVGVVQVYLSLWQTQPAWEGDRWPELNQSARRAIQALRQFARVFPIGQPSFWLWQGLYHWLLGHPDRARRAWSKSIAMAEQFVMPYDQGLAHYQMGCHATGEERYYHLKQACEIFERVGAMDHLAQAQAAMVEQSQQQTLQLKQRQAQVKAHTQQ